MRTLVALFLLVTLATEIDCNASAQDARSIYGVPTASKKPTAMVDETTDKLDRLTRNDRGTVEERTEGRKMEKTEWGCYLDFRAALAAARKEGKPLAVWSQTTPDRHAKLWLETRDRAVHVALEGWPDVAEPAVIVADRTGRVYSLPEDNIRDNSHLFLEAVWKHEGATTLAPIPVDRRPIYATSMGQAGQVSPYGMERGRSDPMQSGVIYGQTRNMEYGYNGVVTMMPAMGSSAGYSMMPAMMGGGYSAAAGGMRIETGPLGGVRRVESSGPTTIRTGLFGRVRSAASGGCSS